jgi:hypothetical protein
MYCNKEKICSITLMFRASEASCGEENGRKKETARRVRTVKNVRTPSAVWFYCIYSTQGIVRAGLCNIAWDAAPGLLLVMKAEQEILPTNLRAARFPSYMR